IFFCQQPHIVLQGEEALKKGARLLGSALKQHVIDEPKTAGKKCPFSGRQTVSRAFRPVAQYQTLDN
ncbi:hypothetical protein QIG19_27245, partial [Klebsiella pneumoniae]|nr:hypothetical protein [Klebsiella pneumoniae]